MAKSDELTASELFHDWQYEVANDDTRLGFTEWLEHRTDALRSQADGDVVKENAYIRAHRGEPCSDSSCGVHFTFDGQRRSAPISEADEEEPGGQ
jgi:hypothetical protein